MIAINCRFLTQETTGVQRFAEEIATRLATQRDDLMLLAPTGPIRHQQLGGVPVTQIGTRHGHAWEQLDLPRYLRKSVEPPLLIGLTNTGPMSYSRQLVTHHDVTYLRHPYTYTHRFRIAYAILSAVTLHRARAVITVSNFSRKEISALYRLSESKVYVVPNAVSAALVGKADRNARRPPYFLAVGSPLPHKNIELLVEAFRDFRRRTQSEARLRIVGSAPPRVGKAADPLKSVESGVDYVGRIDDEALAEAYANALAFVFPSRYEGFGIPPIEAQAADVPVLASNAAALQETLRDSALYFDPDSVKELSQALEEVESNDALRTLLIERGRQNTQRFRWESSAKIVSALLDQYDSDAGTRPTGKQE